MINSGESKIYNPYNVYLNRAANDRFKYGKFHDGLRGLPVNIQDFIFDTVPGDFIKDKISIPFGLDESQSKETAIIVMDLIIADLYLGNIVDEIKNRLGVDQVKAKTIAGLIVAELFRPILEELKKMHIEKFAKTMSSQSRQQNDDRTVDLRQ